MPQLKVLAWNIWMMPSWTRASPKNEARARAIGEELAKLDFDVIVFIKAFDAAARAALREQLGSRFPHRYGPLNFNGPVLKINGGVYVFSRVPLTVVREITWRDSKGVPLFICGDFNTQRRDHTDPFAESPAYLAMLDRLGATNRPDFGETLNDRRAQNDLATDDTGRVAELDYILVRDAGQAITGQWHVLKVRHRGWDGPSGRRDLAYRYGVCCELTLP